MELANLGSVLSPLCEKVTESTVLKEPQNSFRYKVGHQKWKTEETLKIKKRQNVCRIIL